jgi:glycosyltransferase involved in cell wall biosynthesis
MMMLPGIPSFHPHRIVLTFHGSEILRFHRNPLTRWLTRRLIRRATRIGTLTEYTRDLLCRHFPEATAKVCLTPGAVRSVSAPRAAAGEPAQRDKVRILTVGRLHPRKGQRQTLQALLALPATTRAQIEYWIVGRAARGGYAQDLRQAAAAADFPVRFLDDLDDRAVEDAYAQADIFAMTSINHGLSVEGFGLVYLEAAAHGLPVVAHAVGGVREAVVPDVTGLLVAPDDPAALTAAFARLIDDPTLRRQFGEAGRAWASRNNWSDSARQLFDLPAAKP